jgi:hypothetical protein
MIGAMAASMSIQKVIGMSREMIQLANIQIQAEQKLAAVVQATGMAAGFSANELKKQASALQNVTTVGDESILRIQAIMLTFRKVQGRVFEDAIKLSLDLSAVLGQDVAGSALQLGKALEDPIQGITALRRVGVSFTEAQKDHIATLVEASKLYEAQTLILDELRKQVGGVAEELAKTDVGKIQQMQNALEDTKETIGKQLIPLQLKWNQAVSKTIEGYGKTPKFLRYGFGGLFGFLTQGIGDVDDEIDAMSDKASAAAAKMQQQQASATAMAAKAEGAMKLAKSLQEAKDSMSSLIYEYQILTGQFTEADIAHHELVKDMESRDLPKEAVRAFTQEFEFYTQKIEEAKHQKAMAEASEGVQKKFQEMREELALVRGEMSASELAALQFGRSLDEGLGKEAIERITTRFQKMKEEMEAAELEAKKKKTVEGKIAGLEKRLKESKAPSAQFGRVGFSEFADRLQQSLNQEDPRKKMLEELRAQKKLLAKIEANSRPEGEVDDEVLL